MHSLATAGPACDLVEAPQSTAMPTVDWRRYHLSILFVDRYVVQSATLCGLRDADAQLVRACQA